MPCNQCAQPARCEEMCQRHPAAPSTAPAELWLQVDQESPDVDDSTWCRDKINDSDVRYVRADLAGVLCRCGLPPAHCHPDCPHGVALPREGEPE